MNTLDPFLRLAAEHRASDIHIVSGEPLRLRIDGELEVFQDGTLDAESVKGMLLEILTEEEREKLFKNKNLDKNYACAELGNFRLNIFFTHQGMAAVFRLIPSRIPTIDQLRLPPIVSELCHLEKGLILVTGPTGSGKSTTLAAILNHINHLFKYHILTIEDPIEFMHPSASSLVNQREIGASCSSFADALKYALREDPDVIMVGEMRDLETISMALTAAETGHLVLGTLHTRGAGPTVDRILDSFPSGQQPMIRTMLAASLKAVISQSLFKSASGQGRVAALEIMVVNHAISNLIREGKTFQIPSALQVGRKEGMVTFEQSITELLNEGKVNPEEVAVFMEDAGGMESSLMKRTGGVKRGEPAPAQQVSQPKRQGGLSSRTSPSAPPAPQRIQTIPQSPLQAAPREPMGQQQSPAQRSSQATPPKLDFQNWGKSTPNLKPSSSPNAAPQAKTASSLAKNTISQRPSSSAGFQSLFDEKNDSDRLENTESPTAEASVKPPHKKAG